MIFRSLLVTLFVLFSVAVSAQKTLTDDLFKNNLLTPYDNYFKANREMVYTQFNKSRYVMGDDIWFTSWVLNPENKRLSFTTSKLYIELWTPEKKMLCRKILYVKGGTASNYIHIADTLEPGTYCFRAYTNWMRNFYDEKEFNTSITILAPSARNIPATQAAIRKKNDAGSKKANNTGTKDGYDIQFLPESGHFIEGIDNVVGVKAIDSTGHGVMAKGKVVDPNNEEITSFSTNRLGMTNFTITEATSQTLRAIIELPNGKIKEVNLPQVENKGVAININTYLPTVVWIRLQANKLTRSLNQSYYLMVHANGAIYNSYKINFTSSPTFQFKVNKKDLGNGILYATLFDEDFRPVAERLFYNKSTALTGNIAYKIKSLDDDTYKLTVSASDSLSKAQIAKLSFSILPGGTLMNTFTTNLLTESQLRTALKGDIEDPAYYFEKNNTEHLMALDNLMMTQGWRKYNWPEILMNIQKPYAFPSENEFTINGLVKNWIKNKPELKSRISLISPPNNLVMVAPVDNNGQFHFQKLYLADSTYVIASASSVRGAKWNRVLQMSIPETTLKDPDFSQIYAPVNTKDEIKEDIPKLAKGVIQLKEVVVTANKVNPFQKNAYVSFMSRQFELTKDNYTQYADVEQILMSYFNVRVETNDKGQQVFNMGRGTSGSNRNPAMMIDDVRVHEPFEILTFPLNMVQAIAVEKGGSGVMGNGSGLIAISSRTTPLFEMEGDATNLKRLSVKGYSSPSSYFEP
ncbi:MAG: hypothetical protein Q8908_14970, partial [Bacteroidota bacterium]|nr:hypothetical protein [Bacteroidota bacterium]